MCGICGWLDIKREIKPGILEGMNNVVRHRGPDDEGYLMFENVKNMPLRGNDTCTMKDSLEHISKYQGQLGAI